MTLSVYKKGQGTAARGLAGLVAVLLGLWASIAMHDTLVSLGARSVGRIIGTGIVAGVFIGVPLYLILFHHQVVDILIETQQEMRKVAWSTRAEVLWSTAVVLVTVAFLSAFILVTDMVVRGVFSIIRLYSW
jgi:preprotein translocase subunit SecE